MSIPFTKPYFSPEARHEILSAIDGVLASGRLMLGEQTERFERAFAEYIGTAHGVSTNTCTTALQIALMHYVVRGCEVLVPSASFITDVSVVRWAGGTPVLVDCDPATLSFDLDDLRRKVTSRTRAVIWVHLTGIVSSSWREIVAFAREHDLKLIEDCAHAHGAVVGGRKAGSLGDVACFSFYPTKVMTTGTGGMMTTDDADLAAAAREIRNFGRERGVGATVREGNDWFLDEIHACLGYWQLQELEQGLARRRAIARRYDELLSGVPGLRLLEVPREQLPAWYHYTVFVDDAVDYARLASALKEKHGIPTKPIYIPLHQEKIFRDLDDGSLRGAETALNRSLCLPMYVEMDDRQVEIVADAVATEIRELAACAAAS
jgi:perosamine synthetase